MSLNADTPLTYCLVRDEFLHDLRAGHGAYTEACIFAAASIEGRAIAFHAMLRNGAQWKGLPLHAFCMRPCAPLPLEVLALWDCFSYAVVVNQYRYLKPLRCEVRCRDGEARAGKYLFTLDWFGEGYAEIPDQTKSAHLVALDSGHLAAMPNNRILWREPSWIQPMTGKPDYLVNTRAWSAETGAALVDGERYAYSTADERKAPVSFKHDPAGIIANL
ncbi:MAG: hypothetical protein JO010_00820 [Alphaproteobacteria bacterium]|nr:hypothetical protein [Alphaproteobacteria bacterium]